MGCGSTKVIENTYRNNYELIFGYLDEESTFVDSIITNNDKYLEFKEQISRQIKVETIEGEGITARVKISYKDNEEDKFLSKQVEIDFDKQDLIIIRSARIKDLYQMGDTYHIYFEYEYAYNNRYYAIVFNFGIPRPNKINHINPKPISYASDRILEYNPHWINN